MSAMAVAVVVAALAAGGGARELDPAACAARFDVQRDKIIRTEESRDMGARYLSELDVGARRECLRLCCETDACDVFVYEEKGPGSCYLFECGPPEDFRCKFTAHSNFSSGVLALSRRLAELQDQELRAHRDRDLRTGSSTTISTTTVATSRVAAAPPPPPPPPHEPPRRCSRYQFECRRGGECIAVYNACDGVPQCADGSDEAPELGCPASAPAPAPAPARPSATPRAPQQVPPQDLGAGVGEGGGGERWPHRLAQAQAQLQPQHRYTESAVTSHIFSHKGGLVQEPEAAPAPAGPAPAPLWPRRPWPLQPLQLQPGMEMVPEERLAGYWAEADPRRDWPVPQQHPGPPELPAQYGAPRHPLRDSPKKGFELNTEPEPPRPAPEPAPAPAPAPGPGPAPQHTPGEEKRPLDTETNKINKKQDKIKTSQASGVTAGGAPAPHPHYTAEEHEGREGVSERPPAAVLLLVLGVLMTSVLGAMLGCRARAARRRLRRGKSSLAHDADYLVNGMYL